MSPTANVSTCTDNFSHREQPPEDGVTVAELETTNLTAIASSETEGHTEELNRNCQHQSQSKVLNSQKF